MKIMVTGGAGFIGSHLVDELIKQGHKVVVVDSLVNGDLENVSPEANFYHMDINEPGLHDVMVHERPEVVYHFGAQISVEHSNRNPLEDSFTNVNGTLKILNYCVELGVSKIIFASSAAIYGVPELLPIQEGHPLSPISFYGVSKWSAERYITMYEKRFGLNYSILRFANVYGPRQNSLGQAGVITKFIINKLENKPIIIFGDGEQTRDFIYVKDVVQSCIRALTKGDHQIINISSGKEVSVRQLASVISKLSRQPFNYIYEQVVEGDIPNSCLANQHAKFSLDWKPNTLLEEGLKETMDYYSMNYNSESKERYVSSEVK
ncbi:NAD-dependent epimerase/dehydratase family protein [Pseudalkalibacillus berkeleyi]|uniref:NAD-dependent epimerase/dehydratase family protein n=1 Tax=Pseudalkalibacillus berkeleyi TaxID=1069813 RepID=A0ABS9H1A5_9BACL|nr:NAD-dependent epimerase/dehydratase family protein [Pseudalkalibacillus berkeleyi]MCF6138729.1 NAD-dependent epimerase/dehydratase family protein [Pseudalkalibacillus berkeleyi]